MTPLDFDTVQDPARAGVLLSPLRLRILALARSPRSATEIASELRLPRQKVNYHVRELARARFLKKAGRRRKRNLIEQRYVATARSYVLSPSVLGPMGLDARTVEDTLSARYLLAQSVLQQHEMEVVLGEAGGKRVATLSAGAEIRFQTSAERERFAVALRNAVARLIAEHTSPYRLKDGAPAPGRPYRLLVSCYPIPKSPRVEPKGSRP